jgi:SAM-dependent methyltransferase
MGADVTGVDFSGEAIKTAIELNGRLGLHARFICTDIYELPAKLNEQYDIIYTSYGVLGWLPDMKRWAQIVSRYLKPQGHLVLVEFHPVIWMFDNEFREILYSYFNKEAIIETLNGTYANREAEIKKTEIGWNHDLSEVVGSLLDAGLNIKSFTEYDSSPYNCFRNTVEIDPGQFQIKGLEGKIPMLYALKAQK